jgi:hypothetical protein
MKIRPYDILKTAFSTRYGLYEFMVMSVTPQDPQTTNNATKLHI